MLRNFANVRPDERRDTWVAFAVLFGLLASHSMLETARDALFLAKLPASRLPWVYLAIAIFSLVITRAQSAIAQKLTGRAALATWIGGAGLITLGFWAAGDHFGTSGLYALYIWSGVLTMLVLVHFWTLLGDLFSVGQAKRVYAVIGSGSVLGAIVGSATAGALTQFVAPTFLLLVAAGGLLLTSMLPSLLRQPEQHAQTANAKAATLVEAASYVARRPYARQVALLMVVSAITVTFGDYLFKATVAANVPADELGSFFATVYLILNVASLVIQLTALTWIVRRFDISAALACLPLLLLGGGVTFIASAGLAAALIVKGADGSLRYSLHRTATELLFVPMSDSARRRVKAFIDIVGQRGGQALASVVILSAVALGLGERFYAIALVVCAGAWIMVAIGLRPYYIDLFRRRLDRSVSNVADFPELDVGSLETLVAALDSPNEREVIASLDMIAREGKVRIIPSLILYHPSETVVEHALDIFASNGRKRAVRVAKHLVKTHDSARVRAAAVATVSVLSSDERFLRMRLSLEDSAEVRAVIMVNLIASGAIVGSDARDALNAIISSGTSDTRISLAQAIGRRYAAGFDDVLTDLARADEREVRVAAARAMGRMKHPETLPTLVTLLASEDTRPIARESILAFGDQGLAALGHALKDRKALRLVRWQLPKSIGRFDADKAADVLLRNLPDEFDGMVRYRSIRTLERIIAQHPMLRLDRATLRQSIDATVGRCYRYLDRRLSLERGAAADPARKTDGYEILLRMLADKEAHAFDRLFRLLNLAHPKDEFRKIFRSLRSSRQEARAGSLELIENLIKPPLRRAVVGLVDDINDDDRLESGSGYHEPLRQTYEELLSSMLGSSSNDVQDITVFHIGELELVSFEAEIERLGKDVGPQRRDIQRTLGILRNSSTEGAQPHAS